jgi:predicted methyltransferase
MNVPASVRRAALGVLAAAAAFGCAPVPVLDSGLVKMLSAEHRTPGNVARDSHRHPLETLAFFGVREDSAVVEILPGSSGYYMEILAPYLAARGRYVAANRDELAPPQYLADHRKLLNRLAAEPALYGKVVVTKFNAETCTTGLSAASWKARCAPSTAR